MLNVQKYLRGGKTLVDLKAELAIEFTLHETEPLVILNYSMIDSNKLDPIVRECRALVLERETWDIVAAAFPRFFNWGEVQEEMPLFNWDNFWVNTKEDGSLIPVYYYNGEWRINTRSTFGKGECGQSGKSWHDLIYPLIENKLESMDKGYTFVFEFVSPWNKVVRYYKDSEVILLSMFKVDKDGAVESKYDKVDQAAEILGFRRPIAFHFDNLNDIEQYLEKLEKEDPTNEGVVICDNELRRWKMKNKDYVRLHYLFSMKQPNPKFLVPLVLKESNELPELLTYYPEFQGAVDDIRAKLEEGLQTLIFVWKEYRYIEDQKEFAIAIMGKTPFTGILFNVRKKYGKEQSEELLKETWFKDEIGILKHLFGVR